MTYFIWSSGMLGGWSSIATTDGTTYHYDEPARLDYGEPINDTDVFEDDKGVLRPCTATVGLCVPENCARYWENRDAVGEADPYLEMRLWQRDAEIE